MLYNLYNMSSSEVALFFFESRRTDPRLPISEHSKHRHVSPSRQSRRIEAETTLLELNQELNRLQRTIRLAIQGSTVQAGGSVIRQPAEKSRVSRFDSPTSGQPRFACLLPGMRPSRYPSCLAARRQQRSFCF